MAVFLPPPLWLGPMAGYSDAVMRRICHEAGADFCVSEMISAKAMVFRDRKTAALGHIEENEGPVALQLFGKEPDIMAEAARMVEDGYCGGVLPAAIDLNMGCPVPKIAGNGEGSALMKDPPLAGAIVRAVASATRLPVTVKIRTGWDEGSRNAVTVARSLEENGAAAICVHGRTRAQQYSGKADWDTIAAVKAAVGIPVVGNGDVTDSASALALRAHTGCDAIMVARGAVGNPFVFTEIRAALSGLPYTPPTLPERIAMALRQLRLSVEALGEAHAVQASRSQIAAYIRGVPGAAAARATVNLATTYRAVEEALTALTTT